jgi:hypothetical protein
MVGEAVKYCAARGITNGTALNLFSPDMSITRGQFVVMLMRAYGISPDKDTADNFADAGKTYYTGYLSAAKRLGITNGVGNNKFIPEGSITRQDMFTMLYRALKILNKMPGEADDNISLTSYDDSTQIAAYANEALEFFVANGIVKGSGNRLDPVGITSRAQMAVVFYRIFS